MDCGHLEWLIGEQMRHGRVPGLGVGVIQNRQPVYAKGFGVTSVEDGGVTVTPNTLFRIGSISKALTATMIMILVDKGLLDLDKPVKHYTPWVKFNSEGVEEVITLRMLLAHTAGIPTDEEVFGKKDPNGLEEEVTKNFPKYKLVFPPGKVYCYSDLGINMAGYIAEIVTGKYFFELMDELLFQPLEMRRSTFQIDVAMTYPCALDHKVNERGELYVEHRFTENTKHYPSGFGMSTIADMLNFALLHLNQGEFKGKRILSPKLVEEMHRPSAQIFTLQEEAYGVGFELKTFKGRKLVGHGGAIVSFGAKLIMDVEAGVAVFLALNRRNDFDLDSVPLHIIDRLLHLPHDCPYPSQQEPNRELWNRFVGYYVGTWRGLIKVYLTDEGLSIDYDGRQYKGLRCRNDNSYFSSDLSLSVGFVVEQQNDVRFIFVNGCACERVSGDHRVSQLSNQDAEALQSFVGSYHRNSPDLNFVFSFENQCLHLRSQNRTLQCVSWRDTEKSHNNTFLCNIGFIHFDEQEGTCSLGRHFVLKKQ